MFKYDRMNELIRIKGIKKAHICRELGRSPYYLRDAEKINAEISGDALLIMARILGTTPEYLTGDTDDPAPLKVAESPVMSDDFTVAMHGLSKDLTLQAKLALLNMAQQLADAERNRKRENTD